jgi:hypothetical protein
VVNHGLYREKARLQAKDAARVASGADAERKRTERGMSPGVPRSPPDIPAVPLSDSNANTDSNAEKNPSREKTPSKGARRKRATASESTEFPEDLVLDDSMRNQALSRFPDCDVDRAFEKFRARHKAKGSKFVDWRQAWITWIGNFEEYGYPKRKANGETMTFAGKPVEWQ